MSVSKNLFKDPSHLSGYGEDAPILLGLSGGADSSLLLHLLCDWASAAGATVFAAHLNHGIRTEEYGGEADRDESFCRELCTKLGVKLFVKRLDIPKMAAESGRSLETEAREARYGFFAEIMRENNIKILATAHNADDNFETQIYNLARGCGIDGLVGIPETRPLESVDGGVVIRPILSAEKIEILAYCKENSIPYVTDSTNLEDDYTRNAIRHRVIPTLEELFPQIKHSAQRLSHSAAEDSDHILSEAKLIIEKSGDKISVRTLSELHPSVAKRVIKLLFERVSDATLEYVHVASVLSLLDAEKNGASRSLPDQVCARVIDGYLCFEDATAKTAEAVQYSVRLESGFNKINGTRFAVLLSDSAPAKSLQGYSLYACARVRADLSDSLNAKNRQSGMTVCDGGINKKIKKLMCDKKVPLHDRDTLPLVFSDDQIIYAPLCAISDKARTRGGEKALNIGIYQIIGG